MYLRPRLRPPVTPQGVPLSVCTAAGVWSSCPCEEERGFGTHSSNVVHTRVRTVRGRYASHATGVGGFPPLAVAGANDVWSPTGLEDAS
jgi:hypothetical protein